MPSHSPLVPTYHGYILSNEDALLVVQAALANRYPLVKRRPLDSERPELIRSGNVFVFIEESSDIKRWTDGIAWSASRILGRFLVYRRLDRNGILSKDDKRRVKGGSGKRKGSHDSQFITEMESRHGRSSYSSASSTDLISHYENIDPHTTETHLHNPYAQYSNANSSGDVSPAEVLPVAQDRGLIKKTLSLKIPASDLDGDKSTHTVHLISYFSAYDVLAGNLIRPSQTNLVDSPINSSLWSAIKRSSLGGKLLSESEANYYLDSNYQLQNMTSLAVNDDRLSNLQEQQRVAPRRFSSAYPHDAKMNIHGNMHGNIHGNMHGNVPVSAPSTGAPRVPFRAPLSAPIRSPSITSVSSEHHFFPDVVSAPFQNHMDHDYYASGKSREEHPKKRSRSLQSGLGGLSVNGVQNAQNTQPAHYSSMENLHSDDQQYLPRQLDAMQSYVPSSLHHPNFGGNMRGPHSWENHSYAPEPLRATSNMVGFSSSGEDPAETGYEQFSAPAMVPSLNNRAFGLQVPQHTLQKPLSFNSTQPYAFSPQLRWDSFPVSMPAVASAQRLDAHNEETEYDHQVYD